MTDHSESCSTDPKETEQHLMQEQAAILKALYESEAFLDRVQSVAQTGHWYLDIPSGTLSWSRETCRIFGTSVDEPQSLETFFQFLHPDDVAQVNQAWSDALNGQIYQIQHRIMRKDGDIRWVEERAEIFFDESGNPRQGLGTVQDITDRVQTDQELERYRQHLEDMVQARTHELEAARQQAELASRAKSTFLSNMSHEIRTPMNAIIGYAYLMQQDPLTVRQRERLHKMTGAANHLLSIINDILDLSKIESGRLQLDYHEFDPSQLVDQVCAVIADQAAEKSLHLIVKLDPLPQTVVSDSTRVKQILLNLTGNAVKFTHQGSITIRGSLQQTSGRMVHLRFEVIDTGIGLSAQQADRIFQDFTQADASTTRLYGGTGLGLSISKRLAEALGGTIGVSSQLGQGSTFWFEIPVGVKKERLI